MHCISHSQPPTAMDLCVAFWEHLLGSVLLAAVAQKHWGVKNGINVVSTEKSRCKIIYKGLVLFNKSTSSWRVGLQTLWTMSNQTFGNRCLQLLFLLSFLPVNKTANIKTRWWRLILYDNFLVWKSTRTKNKLIHPNCSSQIYLFSWSCTFVGFFIVNAMCTMQKSVIQ